MNNMNKIISFILGLIVVVMLLLLITGRLGVFKKTNFLTISRGNTKTTPTPAKTSDTVKATPTPRKLAQNVIMTATPLVPNKPAGGVQNKADEIKTIPNTGSSEGILILSAVMLLGGVYLRKQKVSS